MQNEETKNKKRENILFSLGGFGSNNLLYNNYIDDEISKKIQKIKADLINEIKEEIKKEMESQFEILKTQLKNEIRINYNDLYEKIQKREDEWEKISDNKIPEN